MTIKKLAMNILKKSKDLEPIKIDKVNVKFNRGTIDDDNWQQAFIEFTCDSSDYSVRYFPNRFVNDYTFFGQPHKTYFEGWYIYSNGEYDVYIAQKEDIDLCKKTLRKLKIKG